MFHLHSNCRNSSDSLDVGRCKRCQEIMFKAKDITLRPLWRPVLKIRRPVKSGKRQTRAANKRSTARKPRPKLAKRKLRAA